MSAKTSFWPAAGLYAAETALTAAAGYYLAKKTLRNPYQIALACAATNLAHNGIRTWIFPKIKTSSKPIDTSVMNLIHVGFLTIAPAIFCCTVRGFSLRLDDYMMATAYLVLAGRCSALVMSGVQIAKEKLS